MSTVVETKDLSQAIQDELKGGFRTMRFAPALENRYEADSGTFKYRYAVTAGLAGIVLYDAFIIADIAMIPDVIGLSAVVRFGIVTSLALVLIAILRYWRNRLARELAQAVVAIACVAGILYLMLASQAPLRMYQHYGVSLVLLYAMILQQVTIRSLGITVLATLFLYIWALHLVPEMQAPVRLSAILVMVGIAGSVLVAGYLLEHKSRMFYLLRLQDRLRNEALDTTSKTDPLTGLGNRRRQDERIAELWARQEPERRPASLIILDIDHFKRFNDRYGHPAGDACIQAVAREGSRAMRPSDLAVRFGGEELVFLLDDCELADALAVAERIRAGIEALAIPHDDSPSGVVTVSLGVASIVPSEMIAPSDLVAAADAALYVAKQSGRNQVFPSPARETRAVSGASTAAA